MTDWYVVLCVNITKEGKTLVHEFSIGADARLMAAAPDLLSALSAMLTHMGMDEDEWNKSTFDQARAAIARATGAEHA